MISEEFAILDLVLMRRIFHEHTRRTKKNKIKIAREAAKNNRLKVDLTTGTTTKTKINKNNPPIDWEKIDLNNKPTVTFSPSKKLRARMIEILDMDNKHKIRRELSDKLETEFLRMYSRYRRMLDVERGLKRPFNSAYLTPSHRRSAAKSAELCIRYSVRPVSLFRYWHNRVAKLKWMHGVNVPPINFLSSDFAVKTVSLAQESDIESDPVDNIAGVFSNSYADLSNLDPRIRRELMKRGFDVNVYNDRELLSVQAAARSLAYGWPIYVDDSILGMARFLAKTIYRNLKDQKCGR